MIYSNPIGKYIKPYPSYKSSGVPWLGDVPAHWAILRLGTVLRERGEINDNGRISDVLSVMKERGVIPYAEKGNVGNKRSEDITRYKIVRADDIVVNCMNVIIGSVGISKYMGCLSPVYYVLTKRSETCNPRYLNLYFQTKSFQLSLVRIGNGILSHRMRIPMELLKCEPFPIPPLSEQTAIVRFLDHADGRIRRAIRAKQKLIKLLEEQKQAIIHRTVTRGLDPNVRLKPSGVEWLGDIPEHWEVKRLKWVTRLQRGYDLPADKRESGAFPVISSGGFIDNHSSFKCVGPGVVMGRYGSTDAVFYVEQNFWPHNTSLFVTDFQGNLPKWCFYLLQTITKADNASKSAVPGVDRKDLFQIIVTVPPVDEQVDIVYSIETGLKLLNEATLNARNEISLLREYRTRLIADVVTGKLDVREAAESLPEEAADPVMDDMDEEDAVPAEPTDTDDTGEADE